MVLVSLKTNDGVVFTVERTSIRKSKMIKDALYNLVLTKNPAASPKQIENLVMKFDNVDEPIELKSVNKTTFDHVKQWCDDNATVSEHIEDDELTTTLSEEETFFYEQFSNRALLDLLIAANYLEIPKLRLKIAVVLRDKIRGVGPEEIRRIFSK